MKLKIKSEFLLYNDELYWDEKKCEHQESSIATCASRAKSVTYRGPKRPQFYGEKKLLNKYLFM